MKRVKFKVKTSFEVRWRGLVLGLSSSAFGGDLCVVCGGGLRLRVKVKVVCEAI